MRMIDTTGVMPMTHGHPAGAVLHVPAPIAAADAEADAAVLGRAAIDQSQGYDDADVKAAVAEFEAADTDIRVLLQALVTTDAFRLRRVQ